MTLLTPKNLSSFQQYAAGEHTATVETPSVDPKAAFTKARPHGRGDQEAVRREHGGDQQKVA